MDKPFERTLYAGWGDVDFNNHMTNAAYMAKAVDVRMMYFAEAGFGPQKLAELGMGPVVLTDEISYFREFALLDNIRVTLALAGLAPDGTRFRLRNELFKESGELAARINTFGGWLDLRSRKLVEPDPGLLAATKGLARTGDFTELPSGQKK